jgi:hypothetical protein
MASRITSIASSFDLRFGVTIDLILLPKAVMLADQGDRFIRSGHTPG